MSGEREICAVYRGARYFDIVNCVLIGQLTN